jgi:hypothetical protein
MINNLGRMIISQPPALLQHRQQQQRCRRSVMHARKDTKRAVRAKHHHREGAYDPDDWLSSRERMDAVFDSNARRVFARDLLLATLNKWGPDVRVSLRRCGRDMCYQVDVEGDDGQEDGEQQRIDAQGRVLVRVSGVVDANVSGIAERVNSWGAAQTLMARIASCMVVLRRADDGWEEEESVVSFRRVMIPLDVHAERLDEFELTRPPSG